MMDRRIEYRELMEAEIARPLFAEFRRRQEVTRCFRKIGGKWEIRPIAFVDDWSPENYDELVRCLKNTVRTGGHVIGAFADGVLKGFASVEPALTWMRPPSGVYLIEFPMTFIITCSRRP